MEKVEITNAQFAQQLRELADRWELLPEETRRPVGLTLYCWHDKTLAALVVKTIGGHWDKTVKDTNTSFSAMVYTSRETGLEVQLYRDGICKIVRPAQPAEYECEPLLSPEEEDELMAEPVPVAPQPITPAPSFNS